MAARRPEWGGMGWDGEEKFSVRWVYGTNIVYYILRLI